MAREVVVFSTEYCPRCDLLKKYLHGKGIDYQERDLGSIESLTDLAMANVFTKEAPVLQVGEIYSAHSQLFGNNGALNESYIDEVLTK